MANTHWQFIGRHFWVFNEEFKFPISRIHATQCKVEYMELESIRLVGIYIKLSIMRYLIFRYTGNRGNFLFEKTTRKTLYGYTVHPHPTSNPTHPQPPILTADPDISPMYSLYLSQRMYSVIADGETYPVSCWNCHNDVPQYIQKIRFVLTFIPYYSWLPFENELKIYLKPLS